MNVFKQGIYGTILMFICVLLFVDFLIFARALTMNERSIRSSIKKIFKIDLLIIIYAASMAFFANITDIIKFFMK